VPRTVKLSERFYQKFGHDLVDELVNWFNETDTTYRAELRELNDLNFARFDAKLEQRLAEVEAGVRQEMTLLRAELREGIADLRAEFRGELGVLRGEFRAQLEAQGRMLIKWMFAFWITTVTTLGGLVVAVLHFLPAARP